MAPQPGDIIAALFTGAAVILLTNPLDTVKNRFQVAKTRSGVLAFGAAEIKRLGLLRALWFPGARDELLRLHDDGRRAHRSLPVAARCHRSKCEDARRDGCLREICSAAHWATRSRRRSFTPQD